MQPTFWGLGRHPGCPTSGHLGLAGVLHWGDSGQVSRVRPGLQAGAWPIRAAVGRCPGCGGQKVCHGLVAAGRQALCSQQIWEEAVSLVRFCGSCHQHKVHQPPGEAAPCVREGAHTGTVEFMVLVQEVQSLDPGKTHLKSVHLRTV